MNDVNGRPLLDRVKYTSLLNEGISVDERAVLGCCRRTLVQKQCAAHAQHNHHDALKRLAVDATCRLDTRVQAHESATRAQRVQHDLNVKETKHEVRNDAYRDDCDGDGC